MTTSQPSSRDISRKLVALLFGANFFGALMIFLYFSVIDPLPVGGASVRSLETEDIVTFGIAGVVIFVGAFAIISWLGRPIQNWLRLIEAGTPASELSSSVALTFSDAPEVEIALHANERRRPDQPALGAGEPATVTTAPAVANAVFDATGVRLRQMPFTLERVQAALLQG